MTIYRSAILLLATFFMFTACVCQKPPKTPTKEKLPAKSLERDQPYRILMTVRYTVEKMAAAVGENALLAKRQCYRKHYQDRNAWYKCIQDPVSMHRVWKLAIVPTINKKLNEIYDHVEKNNPVWKKELKRMVCGLRKGLPRFKSYTAGKYDEATKWLWKIPMTCPTNKPAPRK